MSVKVKVKSDWRTRYQPAVRYAALNVAWVQGHEFTVQALAAAMGWKVTPAMRRCLSDMVREGELFTYLAKHPTTGKIARFYCAQKSKQIEFFKEKVS